MARKKSALSTAKGTRTATSSAASPLPALSELERNYQRLKEVSLAAGIFVDDDGVIHDNGQAASVLSDDDDDEVEEIPAPVSVSFVLVLQIFLF